LGNDAKVILDKVIRARVAWDALEGKFAPQNIVNEQTGEVIVPRYKAFSPTDVEALEAAGIEEVDAAAAAQTFGESIRGLSVALCLGVIIGTYASIMIGTPIMYDTTMAGLKKKSVAKK